MRYRWGRQYWSGSAKQNIVLHHTLKGFTTHRLGIAVCSPLKPPALPPSSAAWDGPRVHSRVRGEIGLEKLSPTSSFAVGIDDTSCNLSSCSFSFSSINLPSPLRPHPHPASPFWSRRYQTRVVFFCKRKRRRRRRGKVASYWRKPDAENISRGTISSHIVQTTLKKWTTRPDNVLEWLWRVVDLVTLTEGGGRFQSLSPLLLPCALNPCLLLPFLFFRQARRRLFWFTPSP